MSRRIRCGCRQAAADAAAASEPPATSAASARASSVLPDPLGPRNRNTAAGRFGSVRPVPCHPHPLRHLADRLGLADHPLGQPGLQVREPLGLGLADPPDRDAGPGRDDRRDGLARDRLARPIAAAVAARSPGQRRHAGAGAGLVQRVERLVRQPSGGHVADRQFDGRVQGVRGRSGRRGGARGRRRARPGSRGPSDGLGSAISTGWKRRSRAGSLSMWRRYSSVVVAPMQVISPEPGPLQDVRGIEPPVRVAGPHDGVELVQEEDQVRPPPQRRQDLLQPLLELAAIRRTGDHARQAQCDDPPTGAAPSLPRSGGQPLDDRRLADAGLADQDRAVLGTPGGGPARPGASRRAARSPGLELAGLGLGGQVAAVAQQDGRHFVRRRQGKRRRGRRERGRGRDRGGSGRVRAGVRPGERARRRDRPRSGGTGARLVLLAGRRDRVEDPLAQPFEDGEADSRPGGSPPAAPSSALRGPPPAGAGCRTGRSRAPAPVPPPARTGRGRPDRDRGSIRAGRCRPGCGRGCRGAASPGPGARAAPGWSRAARAPAGPLLAARTPARTTAPAASPG